MNRITILGCGTSTGVRILGCKCLICQSNDRRNKRLRTSALITFSTQKKILIDASPDLRTQLLRTKTDSLDAVIITHDHADHTHGMDDLRPFCWGKESPIPVHADHSASKDLKRKFKYIFERSTYFEGKEILGGGIPILDLAPLSSGEQIIAGERFIFRPLPHGHEETFCFIQGKCGYITDCREISEDVLTLFHDARLEILAIDCLRRKPHQTHLHLDLTLQYIEKIAPEKAILTHMSHEWDYQELLSELLSRGINNVFPAQDGQSFLYSNS
jgi:phosphoribosyl 1,2-cyclic phosphate phosphodiesterase